MIYNTEMRQIIDSLSYNNIAVPNVPIWKKANNLGKPYYGVSNFCGLDKLGVNADVNLTDLEWAGNEIYLSGTSDICGLISQGLSIVNMWKKQLEQEYHQIIFDIVLSADLGFEDISPSVTLRFWAIRDGYHYINPNISELEAFKNNPILMEQVNYTFAKRRKG